MLFSVLFPEISRIREVSRNSGAGDNSGVKNEDEGSESSDDEESDSSVAGQEHSREEGEDQTLTLVKILKSQIVVARLSRKIQVKSKFAVKNTLVPS